MFYESLVTSAILYAVVCWGSRSRASDANQLNKLCCKVSEIIGVELDPLVFVLLSNMASFTVMIFLALLYQSSHPISRTLLHYRPLTLAMLYRQQWQDRHVHISTYNVTLGMVSHRDISKLIWTQVTVISLDLRCASEKPQSGGPCSFHTAPDPLSQQKYGYTTTKCELT